MSDLPVMDKVMDNARDRPDSSDPRDFAFALPQGRSLVSAPNWIREIPRPEHGQAMARFVPTPAAGEVV